MTRTTRSCCSRRLSRMRRSWRPCWGTNKSRLGPLLASKHFPSAAVCGGTEAASRRHYVEEFKAKRIRVLTNYNVFTQGFDVPAVKAVYLPRPTWSRNVYQQIIGRGLRGPLNGGSEKVLIVNVEDNYRNFG